MSKESNGNFYETIDWYILRETVLERDHWRCIVCGRRAFQAHHLTYAFGLLCDPKWLVSVCSKCHFKIHWKGKEYEQNLY